MTNPIIFKLKKAITFLFKKKVMIDSAIVGTRLKSFMFRVESRQISNFAAAIGDENHHYYITKNHGIHCAHPVFPVRISWEIIKDLSRWLETDFPVDLSTPLVHQGEYLDIRRLPEADDQLTVYGQIAALEPHRRGAKLVLKFEYHDGQGEQILTEFISAVLFNVTCRDEGRRMDLPPEVPPVEEDSPLWDKAVDVSRTTPYIYDGCTEISYPLHTDPQFARQMGLPDIILQGTATLAMSVSVILHTELAGDPSVVRTLAAKFTDIVIPPNRLTVRLLKKTDKQYYFDVREKNGRYAIRGGYLEIN
jgi:hypothetical protein